MSARPIRHVLAAVLSLAFICATPSAHAQKGASGLPIPRFVSLAAKEVNLRAGPGKNYPVTWVFVRKGLPVMVTAEFEYWRKVRDLDGEAGADLVVTNRLDDNISVLLSRCIVPPLITTQPPSVVLVPAGGGVAELGVVVRGGRPLTYHWRRDGEPLIDGGGVSGATTPTLTIDATVEDVAAYDVVVTNASGSDTSEPSVIAVRTACQADFDGDGQLTLFDFLAFQNAFDAGCP